MARVSAGDPEAFQGPCLPPTIPPSQPGTNACLTQVREPVGVGFSLLPEEAPQSATYPTVQITADGLHPGKSAHQNIVVYTVEELLKVHVHHPSFPTRHGPARLHPPTRSQKPVAWFSAESPPQTLRIGPCVLRVRPFPHRCTMASADFCFPIPAHCCASSQTSGRKADLPG